ncbi:hypothetical protein Bbelb_052830 [Branchiostoma belcheri]|nr:hypothetical protein Bbelb_052830 [Branchiostoma belcheri]
MVHSYGVPQYPIVTPNNPTCIEESRLLTKANTIVSDPQDLETEKSHLTQALKTCGYSQWAINKATCPRSPNNKPSTGAKSKGLVVLPYIKDLSEALRRIFMSHDIFSCTR